MSLLKIESTGAVRTVTLARPEKRNALSPEMMTEIIEAFEATPPADERVTVIRAEGPSFCSGLQLATSGIDKKNIEEVERMFNAVYRYPMPVIAIVQGTAVAGGCELALHCDFVVAAKDARFEMPLAQLGVCTTWFLTKKIMDAAGPVLAREFLLLGDAMLGERLHNLGIVARVAETEDLDAEAEKLIDRLAKNAPLSMRTMKEIMIQQADFVFGIPHDSIEKVARGIYATHDAVEGVAAKVERRAPKFIGA